MQFISHNHHQYQYTSFAKSELDLNAVYHSKFSQGVDSINATNCEANKLLGSYKRNGKYAAVELLEITQNAYLLVKLAYSEFIEEVIEIIRDFPDRFLIRSTFNSNEWIVIISDKKNNISNCFCHKVLKITRQSTIIDNYF